VIIEGQQEALNPFFVFPVGDPSSDFVILRLM